MSLSNEDLILLYRNMERNRALDTVVRYSVAAGKLASFWHSGLGQEATGVGPATFLRPDDYLMYSHRFPSQVLAKGMDPKAFLAEHYGKSTGCCGGRNGYHAVDLANGMVGINGILGSIFSITAGLGIACKKRGQGQVVMACFGDGTAGRGPLHEAFLMAANWKLPIIWLNENNKYGMFVPVEDSFPLKDIADLAAGYGIPGVVVDGQDVVAVWEAVDEAVARARRGEGPTLLECKTYRFALHCEGIADMRGGEVRTKEEIELEASRDPIFLFRTKLLEQGLLTEEMVAHIQAEAKAEMEAAEKFADESPLPDPATLYDGLFV